MPDSRWKAIMGTQRNEKAIHDFLSAETKFKMDAANEIAKEGRDSAAVSRLQSAISPVDRANTLLKQGNLPVAVTVQEGELKAVRDNNIYSIAKMSDGERIALVLIAEITSEPIGSVFVIDEPEVHLHKAIVVPLLAAIIRENKQSTFIISTHELELVGESPHGTVIVVRGCSWNGNACVWDFDSIPIGADIPEDVRLDILGSRRKMLFIEGIGTSLDQPFYSLLFPNTSVRSRENCREVERAVTGLRATKETHHCDAFGIIDGDGINPDQANAFRTKAIYPLGVHSVEGLYYAPEVLEAIAKRQAETIGLKHESLLEDSQNAAIRSLTPESISHLAGRVAERRFREQVIQHIPDRNSLMTGDSGSVSFSVPSTYPRERQELETLCRNKDVAAIVKRYPVRESGILDALAKGLRFSSRADYEKAVLQRLSIDDELCSIVRSKLGELALKLA